MSTRNRRAVLIEAFRSLGGEWALVQGILIYRDSSIGKDAEIVGDVRPSSGSPAVAVVAR